MGTQGIFDVVSTCIKHTYMDITVCYRSIFLVLYMGESTYESLQKSGGMGAHVSCPYSLHASES